MRLSTFSMALAIALAVGISPSMAAESRAHDPAGSSARLIATSVSTASAMFAGEPVDQETGHHSTPNQSGSVMPPMPETGTLAILIAGLGMIGFAVSRPAKQA